MTFWYEAYPAKTTGFIRKRRSDEKVFVPLFWAFLTFLLVGMFAACSQEEISNSVNSNEPTLKTHTNSIGMEFVLIPAGSFKMGCNPEFENCVTDELPQHSVTISRPFYLGKYEVTQQEWVAIMGENPSKFKGRNNPVEHVSWDDVQIFIRRLNEKERADKYRLPTEAEWEYAARAGSTTTYYFGNAARQLGNYAWHDGREGTHPVGQKQPNNWGLYDMYGNVFEWVQDWYGKDYYANSSGSDPGGPSSGEYRVLRGGGWNMIAWYCRTARRYSFLPDLREGFVGFRLAFSPVSSTVQAAEPLRDERLKDVVGMGAERSNLE